MCDWGCCRSVQPHLRPGVLKASAISASSAVDVMHRKNRTQAANGLMACKRVDTIGQHFSHEHNTTSSSAASVYVHSGCPGREGEWQLCAVKQCSGTARLLPRLS